MLGLQGQGVGLTRIQLPLPPSPAFEWCFPQKTPWETQTVRYCVRGHHRTGMGMGTGMEMGTGMKMEQGQGQAGSDAQLPLPPSRPERGTPTLVQLGVAFLSLSLQK